MTRLMQCTTAAVLFSMLGGASNAAAGTTFGTESARGRYTGNVAVTETFTDGTNTVRIEARFLAALTFDGKAGVTGAATVTVAIPGQGSFNCPYAVTGTYEIGEAGLGTASLDMLSPLETCSGGVTLKTSLVIGGLNRKRIDLTIDRAISSVDGELPLVGSGTLEK